jgi:hypothetical protein
MVGFREWWASRSRVRPTSVTTPFVGMAWELGPSSRVVLEKLVTFIDNRRVLQALLDREKGIMSKNQFVMYASGSSMIESNCQPAVKGMPSSENCSERVANT